MVTSTQPLVKNNVAMLNIKSVHSHITSFLLRKNIGNGEKLKGTASEYERDIRRFFQVMRNKATNELEIEDLDMFKEDVHNFQLFLVNNGYKSATVNRNINTMRSLYNSFQESKLRYKNDDGEWVYIVPTIFNVDDVVLNDAETYGMFTHEEMCEVIENAKSLPNGELKSLAIELASKTAFRIEAIANLTMADIRKEGNVYVVKTIDKKKVHEKPITEDLGDRLLSNSESMFFEGKIFNFTTKTLERAINTLTEKMNLDLDRNLTFHSIKKYSMGEVYRITNGDPLAVAKHGNHSSFETSMKYYLLFANEYEKNPALLIGKELDLKPLEEMSKQKLLQLITESSRALQFELLNKVAKTQ